MAGLTLAASFPAAPHQSTHAARCREEGGSAAVVDFD